MPTESDEVDVLVDELFRLVEESQGYFFFSDGETFPTKAEFFGACARTPPAWPKSGAADGELPETTRRADLGAHLNEHEE